MQTNHHTTKKRIHIQIEKKLLGTIFFVVEGSLAENVQNLQFLLIQ